MDILSWEIAEVVSPCLPRGLWSEIAIRVFLLLVTVCPRHPPYPVLPCCPLLRAFPYPQPGDTGGRRSAPAICQFLTSADPTVLMVHYLLQVAWWRRQCMQLVQWLRQLPSVTRVKRLRSAGIRGTLRPTSQPALIATGLIVSFRCQGFVCLCPTAVVGQFSVWNRLSN